MCCRGSACFLVTPPLTPDLPSLSLSHAQGLFLNSKPNPAIFSMILQFHFLLAVLSHSSAHFPHDKIKPICLRLSYSYSMEKGPGFQHTPQWFSSLLHPLEGVSFLTIKHSPAHVLPFPFYIDVFCSVFSLLE